MLAWLDIESTGLDPRSDRILEVGIIVTDDDLNEIWRTSRVCRFLGDMEKVNPFVREMHEKSGLWKECAETQETAFSVESSLVACMSDLSKEEKMPLCGNTISFDRSFLREHMPRLLDCFHYRSVDVSSLTELARRWHPEVYEGRPGADKNQIAHRSLADLESSIAQLRYYREKMFR